MSAAGNIPKGMIAVAGTGNVGAGAQLAEGALVHESAYVDDDAVIGASTRVWHFCHIVKGAVIGERCSIGQNVVVMNGTRLGNNVRVQNNVSIYEGVELDDDVFCGPSMVFTNVFNPRSAVSRKNEYRKTFVHRGASIGANATIVCGITIGQYAFIGAGAVVNRDVPDYALMMGVPARQHGWMSEAGYTLESLGGEPGMSDREMLRCPGTGILYVREGDVVTRLPEAQQRETRNEERA